jgi:hypothetical protein
MKTAKGTFSYTSIPSSTVIDETTKSIDKSTSLKSLKGDELKQRLREIF